MKRAQNMKSKPARGSIPRKRRRVRLSDLLIELEKAGLVRYGDEPEPVFLFKHTLTQETAYQSLLNRTRREIHLDIARIYENLYPDRLDEYAPILAHHYAEGGNEPQAFVYEARAGDVSMRLFASAEAIGYYTRALEIIKRAPVLPLGDESGVNASSIQNLYLKRGRALELSGKYDEALKNYDEMRALAQARGDRAMELASLLATATVVSVPTSKYNPQLAKELSDRALIIAREIGDRGAQAHILRNLMLITRWLKDPSDAARYGEESLAIAREYNLREDVAYTLNDLAVHGYLDSGEFGKALAASSEARQLWQEMNNLPMLADSTSSSALAQYALGNFDAVIAASNESLKITEAIGNLWGQSYAQWIVGNVYADRGEPARAIQIMDKSISLGEQVGFAGAEVGVRNMQAPVYADCGMIDRALEIAKKSVAVAEPRFAAWLMWSDSILARLYVRVGKIDEAEAALDRAKAGPVEYHIGRGMAQISCQLTLAGAEIALATNDRSHSMSSFDTLIDYLQKTGARVFLPEVLYVRAQVELAREQIDLSLKTLTDAREIAESLGARRRLWQIYLLLAEIQTRRGNESESRSLRRQAREITEYIAAHATDEQRAAFSSLPAVRELNLADN